MNRLVLVFRKAVQRIGLTEQPVSVRGGVRTTKTGKVAVVRPYTATRAKRQEPARSRGQSKEPWQMTRDEMVRERIAKHESEIATLNGQIKCIPGNLTRRKDRSDLRIASESVKPMQRIMFLQDRISKLKSPEAQGEIEKIHRDLVHEALAAGKPVPTEVLADYHDLKPPLRGQGEPPQTDTPAFKRWFGDSKVVNEDGSPKVVYHGTNAKTFDVFNTESEGAHFGTREQAEYQADKNRGGGGKRKVVTAYISLKNPLRLPDLGVWSYFDNVRSHLSVNDIITQDEADKTWNAWQRSDKAGWDTLKEVLERHGHDGIVYENEQEGPGDSYIVFHSNQVKSADKNRDTFDPASQSISKALLFSFTKGLHGGGHPLDYKTEFQDLPISIEQRKGSIRRWMDHTGKSGETKFAYPYGYIRLTQGIDGDHVDCFIGPNPDATHAYVIHQMKRPTFTALDEDKVMLGFNSAEEAKAAYLRHYDDPRFFGSMDTMPMEKFKRKVLATKDQPGMLKALSKMDQEDAEHETAAIRERAKTREAQRPHRFHAARWTHKNGHPRCRLCGEEEREGGLCAGRASFHKSRLWLVF